MAKIVEAVGAAAVVTNNPNMGRAIEEAMSNAVKYALSKGITDPVEQKKLMQAARQQVKEEFRSREEAAAKEANKE